MRKAKRVKSISYKQVAQAAKEWGQAYVVIVNNGSVRWSDGSRVRMVEANGMCFWDLLNNVYASPLLPINWIPSCFGDWDRAAYYDKCVRFRTTHARIVGLYKSEQDVLDRVRTNHWGLKYE